MDAVIEVPLALLSDRRPDEEGIKTKLPKLPFLRRGFQTADLTKKGLRRTVPRFLERGFPFQTADLTKKGLRHRLPTAGDRPSSFQTADLTKKGLRRHLLPHVALSTLFRPQT